MDPAKEYLSISVKDRHKSRKLCVEALYFIQFREVSKDDIFSLGWLTGTNLPTPLVMKYYEHLMVGILNYKDSIDLLITSLAPKYQKERIFKIDIAILELGLYLLFYDEEEIPYRIIINEAVKLTKEYGGIEAHKFVNAVLDSAYKQKDTIKNSSR